MFGLDLLCKSETMAAGAVQWMPCRWGGWGLGGLGFEDAGDQLQAHRSRSRRAERSLSNEDFLEFKSQAVEFGSAMLENVLDKLSDEHGSHLQDVTLDRGPLL